MATIYKIVRKGGTGKDRTQFGEHDRSDAGSVVSSPETPGGEPIVLHGSDDYDSFTPDSIGQDQYGPIDFIDVRLNGDGTLIEVEPVERLDLTEYAETHWLEHNWRAVNQFFFERYNGALDTDDDEDTRWSNVQVRFYTQIDTVDAVREDAYMEALASTNVVKLHQEADHGTNGTENLGRLLKEYVASVKQLKDGLALRDAYGVTDRDIDSQVELRSGEREISDQTAVAICRSFDAAEYPAFAHYGNRGIANYESLRDDTIRAYNSTYNARNRLRLDALGTYFINGGDNS